jgi:hypothetical protein
MHAGIIGTGTNSKVGGFSGCWQCAPRCAKGFGLTGPLNGSETNMRGLARFGVTPLAWRLGFLYAALFLVVGCYLPYMPVWLQWRGLDEDEIAILLAAPLFARILFTPAISFAADWSGARRALLIALAWGTLVSLLLLWASSGFWQMLLAAMLLPSTGPPSCR